MSLNANIGESVPILSYESESQCSALNIAPLFNDKDVNYSSRVSQYFTSTARTVSRCSIFMLLIDEIPRFFQITQCLPKERCITTGDTKVFFDKTKYVVTDYPIIPYSFSDIAFEKTIIELVRNAVWLPMNRPQLYDILDIDTSSGLIVYSKKGNGKTAFLSAVAKILNVPTRYVYCKNLGHSKNAIAQIRKVFEFAYSQNKCLLVFDDIDYIANDISKCKYSEERERTAQFISLLDKAMKNPKFSIIASSSSKGSIDNSLIRIGRFGYEIDLDDVTITEKEEIIRLNTRGLSNPSLDISSLAANYTEGFTRSDVEKFCMNAIAKMINPMNPLVVSDVPNNLIAFSTTTKLNLNHFIERNIPRRESFNDQVDTINAFIEGNQSPQKIKNPFARNTYGEEPEEQRKPNPFANSGRQETGEHSQFMQRGWKNPFA
ncbi:cell division cycle protein [Histomonas meleagridis]|uniref:cell division cycle protein 48 n=1 Tax=Histomonas meleagridis TaxID=135588 RepID=UPI00355A1450|nr:cell division cycle protein [Histomonas meleagridis]KAH0803011.1 cell division cycle protein 48 [Histomonas meleagridis]